MNGKQNLAENVRKRRIDLGYRKIKDFAKEVGVTPRLIGEIENARRDSYSPTTLQALDSELGWTQGTSARLLAGTTDLPELSSESIYNESDCGVTLGLSEYLKAVEEGISFLQKFKADFSVDAKLELSTRTRGILLAMLLDIDLTTLNFITGKELSQIIDQVSSQSEALIVNNQIRHKPFWEDALPSGCTAADHLRSQITGSEPYSTVQEGVENFEQEISPPSPVLPAANSLENYVKSVIERMEQGSAEKLVTALHHELDPYEELGEE